MLHKIQQRTIDMYSFILPYLPLKKYKMSLNNLKSIYSIGSLFGNPAFLGYFFGVLRFLATLIIERSPAS